MLRIPSFKKMKKHMNKEDKLSVFCISLDYSKHRYLRREKVSNTSVILSVDFGEKTLEASGTRVEALFSGEDMFVIFSSKDFDNFKLARKKVSDFLDDHREFKVTSARFSK